jgi:hypothetical protein
MTKQPWLWKLQKHHPAQSVNYGTSVKYDSYAGGFSGSASPPPSYHPVRPAT